jgi:hypothetical protein
VSQPKVGDTVYIMGTVEVTWDYHDRLAARVCTNQDGHTDSFAIYADQILLIESPDEVSECVG